MSRIRDVRAAPNWRVGLPNYRLDRLLGARLHAWLWSGIWIGLSIGLAIYALLLIRRFHTLTKRGYLPGLATAN